MKDMEARSNIGALRANDKFMDDRIWELSNKIDAILDHLHIKVVRPGIRPAFIVEPK